MKYQFVFIACFLPALIFSQVQKSLGDLLWESVNPCYALFEDMDEDGQPDFEQVDDAKNGYLKIAGTFPTCGCRCQSTVDAYRDQKGQYTILQSDEFSCEWKRQLSANRPLKAVLPKSFSLQSFASKTIVHQLNSAAFFLDIEIPRKGTDTKVQLKLIPFGLESLTEDPFCFKYQEQLPYKSLHGIAVIADKVKDPLTLTLLLEDRLDEINMDDRQLIQNQIGDNGLQFKTIDALQKELIRLKQVYEVYNNLATTELILGWDRANAQFYIKQKGKALKKTTFKDFLANNSYWMPIC